MKKLFALVISVLVFAALCSFAFADDGYITFEKEEYSLSAGWNTMTVNPVTHNINMWLQYEWYSENEEIATVTNYGAVRGLSEGSTVIHCKGADINGNTYESSYIVNVIVPLERVSVEQTSVTLAVNDGKIDDIPEQILPFYQHTPNLTFYPENATYKELEWSSSNPAVAEVSEDGVVTSGSTAGNASITGKAKDGSWASVQIYVTVSKSFVSATSLRFTENEPQIFGCVAKSGSGSRVGIEVTTAGSRRINETWDFGTTGDCFKLESIPVKSNAQKANNYGISDNEEGLLCYKVVPVKAGYGTIRYIYNGVTKFTVSVTVEQSAVE